MSLHQLGVPGEALVQGRKIGFRNGSHWQNSYIIIEPRVKSVGKRDPSEGKGREVSEEKNASGAA